MSTFVIEDYADLDDYLNNQTDEDYRVYEQYEFDVPYYLTDTSKPEFKGASLNLPVFLETLREEKYYENKEGKRNSANSGASKKPSIPKSEIDKVTKEYNERVKLFWSEYGKNINAPKCVYEEQYVFDTYDDSFQDEDTASDVGKWKGPIITEIFDDENEADASKDKKTGTIPEIVKNKEEPKTDVKPQANLELHNVKIYDTKYYDECVLPKKTKNLDMNEKHVKHPSTVYRKPDIVKQQIPNLLNITSHQSRFAPHEIFGTGRHKAPINVKFQPEFKLAGKTMATNFKRSLLNNHDFSSVFPTKLNFFDNTSKRFDPYETINIKLNACDYFGGTSIDNLMFRKNGFAGNSPRLQTHIPFLFETNKNFNVYPTAPPVIPKKTHSQKRGHSKSRHPQMEQRRNPNRAFEDSWLLPYEVVDAYGEDIIKLINNHNRLIDNFPDDSKQFTSSSYDRSLREVDIYDLPAGSIFAEASQPIPEISIYGTSDSRLPTFNNAYFSARKNTALNPTNRMTANYPQHTQWNYINNAHIHKTSHRHANESYAFQPRHNFDKVNVTVSAKSRFPGNNNTTDETASVLEKLNDIYHYVITTTPSENVKCKIEEVHGSLLTADNNDGFKESVSPEETKAEKGSLIITEEDVMNPPTYDDKLLKTSNKIDARKPSGILITQKGELKTIHQAVGKKESPKKVKDPKYVDF